MEPFIAQIMMFGGNFAPRGWAFCDGQLLPISQYSALFSLLGTTYGGDGRTTFGLPDLRGRVAIHPGNGPGLSSIRLGEKGGTETNTLSTAQLPPHTHGVSVPSKEEGNTDVPAGNYVAGAGLDSFGTITDSSMKTFQTLNAGGGQSINNIQPFQCVNYIIALQGIFPSRS
ncbi:Microcystin-dependent protein [Maribacter orientalis]|uniref:Microcystin-dependent protein n=1 Tax=Maribacter orientalis TaxID=228957 RepID=A0A1H7EZH5_9FLAO|nr:tail fiber protein [Maribacter orientalis]SEK18994.1 Microcystin-dependent protein [Maribacter orientalis]|tara:strand:+ start:487 stop:999 length:513 start_codon:yes stop_codon:yes gene_type:complete